MAQPELESFRRRAVLIKAETTEGVDAGPVPGTDAFRFYDGTSSTEYDVVDRNEDKPHFGASPFGIANRRATIGGTFDLYPPQKPGQGTDSDAFCDRVLFPSGMAVAKDPGQKITRYNPISKSIPTATVHFYHGGTLVKALGARGNVTQLGIEIGGRFSGQASLMGEYARYEKADPPTGVVLPGHVPVISSKRNSECILGTLVRGGTETTSGTPLSNLHTWAKALQIDFGNQLGYREYTEKGVSGISDRAGSFTLRLAKTDIADDFDPWFVRDNGIILTAAYRLYESDAKTGLYSELGIRAQIEQISPTDIEGDYGWEISGRLVPSPAGNDEFYIGFGEV